MEQLSIIEKLSRLLFSHDKELIKIVSESSPFRQTDGEESIGKASGTPISCTDTTDEYNIP